jgi:hypothetical protein
MVFNAHLILIFIISNYVSFHLKFLTGKQCGISTEMEQ